MTHQPGPHLRAPYAGDFGTGPNICLTIPPHATITTLMYEDGAFAEVAISTGAAPEIYLTLPTAGLEVLIEELDAIQAGAPAPYGIDRSSRWATAPTERPTNPARPLLLPAPDHPVTG